MISSWRMVEGCAYDGTPTLEPARDPYVEKWCDDKDGSDLLQKMIRRRDERLAELGEPDEPTDRIIELLRLAEQNMKPIEEAALDRMMEIGPPLPDDWDVDYNPRDEKEMYL